MIFLLKCIYLLLPAMFANMAPVFVKKINFLAMPIDFNKKMGSNPIFGKNKTIRGFAAGIVMGIAIAFVQKLLMDNAFFSSISLLDYSNFLLTGFLLGFGAMFGDLAESFVKRRLGIKPGKTFFPFDQLDAPMGAIVFLLFVYTPAWEIAVSSVVLFFVLHIIVRNIGYYLKIDKERW